MTYLRKQQKQQQLQRKRSTRPNHLHGSQTLSNTYKEQMHETQKLSHHLVKQMQLLHMSLSSKWVSQGLQHVPVSQYLHILTACPGPFVKTAAGFELQQRKCQLIKCNTWSAVGTACDCVREVIVAGVSQGRSADADKQLKHILPSSK